MIINAVKRILKSELSDHILSAIIGAIWSLSMFFYQNESVLTNAVRIPIILARAIIGYFVFLLFINIINKNGFRRVFFDNETILKSGFKSFFKDCLLFAFVWLPALLIKYPGASCWDTWWGLYYYRIGEVISHHSVLYAVIHGDLISLFEKTGHANWGLWLFVALHYLAFVLTFGYAAGQLRKYGVKKHIRSAIIVLWCLSPFCVGYIGVAMKDVLYSLLMFLCTMFLMNCLSEEDPLKCRRYFIGIIVSSVLFSLLRKNGVYILFLAIVYSLFLLIKKRVSINILLVLLISLVLSLSFDALINSVYNAKETSSREALSLPFQQTARYVRDHGDDVTDVEREIIDKVLPYDELSEQYNPRLSDSVKNRYKDDDSALAPYFKVWAKQFTKHPITYFAATLEQNYYLFVPETQYDNEVFYENDDKGYELGKAIIVSERTKYYEPIFYSPAMLNGLKAWLVSASSFLQQNIITGTFSNISLNFYALILISYYLLKKNETKRFLPLLFAWGTVIFVILGPAIQ